MKPYAVTAVDSRGREHAEEFPKGADPFAIDRQRVLHSAAFRRLEYKTQVFVVGEHDHFRTRLTHTLEVASIARRLCVGLEVNVAVGELIALTHDLGHPPFGHAGESALRDLMKDHGGFEHNAQSLRVIEYLEHPYPALPRAERDVRGPRVTGQALHDLRQAGLASAGRRFAGPRSRDRSPTWQINSPTIATIWRMRSERS